MNNLKERIHNFLSDKKNIKLIVVSLIVVVTVVGIVLGVTIAPSNYNDSEASSTSTNTSIGKGDATDDANSLAALAGSANAGSDNNRGTDNTFSRMGEGGSNGQGGLLYDANGNPVSMRDGSIMQGESASGGAGTSGSTAGGGSEGGKAGGASDTTQVNCTIAIDCSAISGNGVLTAAGYPELEPYAANPSILSSRSITATDTNGDGRVSVEEAIKQVCNANGIQYEFKGANYLRGINYLYEFNAGPNSGWMYNVNGISPNRGCNTYYLNGGEDILWYYVISY